MKRILVATDFSTRSDRALRRAILLARTISATLDLVHVVDADQPEKLVRSQQRDATGQFTELSAAETIRQSARMLRSDLVVIGTQGRSAVGNLLLGSVAEEVLRNSAVDVMVVPQAKEASIFPARPAWPRPHPYRIRCPAALVHGPVSQTERGTDGLDRNASRE